MMYGKLHHIGIGVRDLKKTIELYENILGFKLEKTINWDKEGLKAAIFPIGETKLEFIEPSNPKGEIPLSIAEAVKLKDRIVHHLCFSVGNIEKATKKLMAKGFEVIIEEPQAEAGDKIAWLNESEVGGFMIELCQEGYEIK